MIRSQRQAAWVSRVAIWNDPDDPRHGTVNGYNNLRCRCDACRVAWASRIMAARERRAIQLAEDDPRHGQTSTYVNYLCRCAECRAASARTEAARTKTKKGRAA